VKGWRVAACAVAAVGCLTGAAVAGLAASAEAGRQPSAAELDKAAAGAVSQRWERATAGTVFPASIGYSTDLLTAETATRAGISPSAGCAAALDGTLTGAAVRYRCAAGLRASYVDELQGTVYTIGVLAFPDASAAAAFYRTMPAPGFPATGLRALGFGGTATARFGDAQRQVAEAQQAGSYVILAVAGYADGRAAAATAERRNDVFAPEGQLVSAVVTPLTSAATVDCGDAAEWSC